MASRNYAILGFVVFPICLATTGENEWPRDDREIEFPTKTLDILELYRNPKYRELALTWIGNYFTIFDPNDLSEDRSAFIPVKNNLDLLSLVPNSLNNLNDSHELYLLDKESTHVNSVLDNDPMQMVFFNPSLMGSVKSNNNPFSEIIKYSRLLEGLKKSQRQVDRLKRTHISRYRMKEMLNRVFSSPRNHLVDPRLKNLVKVFIAEKFLSAKLMTFVQEFKPIQYEALFYDEAPLGNNVIGVLPGRMWGTPEDRITLVGAHWDTVNSSSGYNDNGSGMVAMLEVIRLLTANNCVPQYSLMFVAFDLEEYGSQGSLHFIKDYLSTLFRESPLKPHFQGAFVLDTIMNYNNSEQSQIFPEDWTEELSQTVKDIHRNGGRGNFQSVIFRKGVEDHLAESFSRHWGRLENNNMSIRALGVDLPPKFTIPEELGGKINFLRSDHARFWYFNTANTSHSFRAVLITDTGPYRGLMRGCYHKECDKKQIMGLNNSQSLTFLAKTTQALTNCLIELNNFKCYGVNKKGNKQNPKPLNRRPRKQATETTGDRDNKRLRQQVTETTGD